MSAKMQSIPLAGAGAGDPGRDGRDGGQRGRDAGPSGWADGRGAQGRGRDGDGDWDGGGGDWDGGGNWDDGAAARTAGPGPGGPRRSLHGQARLAPPRRPRRRARRAVLAVLVACLACVTAAALAHLLLAERGTASGSAGAVPVTAGLARTGGAPVLTRPVAVTAGPAATVELRGVPGQLAIARAAGSRVTLTGQLQWRGHSPLVVTRLDRATGVLRLSYQCAPASPCSARYRLAVPAGTATVIRQPSGHVEVSGLAGPLSITAVHADIAAAGLRSPLLAADITSGHLAASFDLPPRTLSIALSSAQATVWLPRGATYRIRQQVSGGFVRIGVAHAHMAARTVTARIASGELDLLPAAARGSGRAAQGYGRAAHGSGR